MVTKQTVILTEQELINFVNESANQIIIRKDKLRRLREDPELKHLTEEELSLLVEAWYNPFSWTKEDWHTVLDVVSLVLTVIPATSLLGVGLGLLSGMWYVYEGDTGMGVAMIVLELFPLTRMLKSGGRLVKKALKELGGEGVEALTKKVAKVGFDAKDFTKLTQAEKNLIVGIGKNKKLQREILEALNDPKLVGLTDDIVKMSDAQLKAFAKDAGLTFLHAQKIQTLLVYGGNSPYSAIALFNIFNEIAWMTAGVAIAAPLFLGVEYWTNPEFRKIMTQIMHDWVNSDEIEAEQKRVAERYEKSMSYIEKQVMEDAPEAYEILLQMILVENCEDMEEDDLARANEQMTGAIAKWNAGEQDEVMTFLENELATYVTVDSQCFKDWMGRLDEAGNSFGTWWGCTVEGCTHTDVVPPTGLGYVSGGPQWDNNDFPLRQGKGDDGQPVKKVTAVQRWLNDVGNWTDANGESTVSTNFKGCNPTLKTDGKWGSNLQGCFEDMRKPSADSIHMSEKYYNKWVRVPYERYVTRAEFDAQQKINVDILNQVYDEPEPVQTPQVPQLKVDDGDGSTQLKPGDKIRAMTDI